MDTPPDLPPKEPKTRPRRRKSETRQRERRVSYRLTEAEYAEVQAAADHARLTLASYARARTVGAPVTGRRHRAPIDATALGAVMRAFTKVATNINQIARALNMRNIVMPEELVAVAIRLDADRAAVMTAIKRRP